MNENFTQRPRLLRGKSAKGEQLEISGKSVNSCMKIIAEQLREIVSHYHRLLEGVEEESLAFKPSPGKWSGKEIMGHLIDSAQNNLRRFIVAQYEDTPKIVYRQDDWVKISGYQHWPTAEIVQLWTMLNLQIVRVLENASGEAAKRLCLTNDPEPHTIEWLAADYIKHLLHHLHQVLRLEPVAYP
jgi:hypothetical protein